MSIFRSLTSCGLRQYQRIPINRGCSIPMAFTTTASNTLPAADSPWDPNYPIARNQTPTSIMRSEVISMLRSGKQPGKDFILVDLRQVDHEGGTIRGSINLPAQHLYPAIPTLYNLFKSAHIEHVIWFCGSSQHRGLRAAAWFDDYIKEQQDPLMKSLMLFEGVKGWANAGTEYTALMDEYSNEVWG